MANYRFLYSMLTLLFLGACGWWPMAMQSAAPAAFTPAQPDWVQLSTQAGDLPLPSQSTRQPAALIFDIDRDGINDFVIASRREPGSAVVWYQRHAGGWHRMLIDDTVLDIEAGGTFHDLDGDGDLDLVLGGDSRSNQIWWWENPHPQHTPDGQWTRRLIKDDGAPKHHDMLFGDFNGDGRVELAFWNQHARGLFLAEVPADPKASGPWPYTAIYRWAGGQEHEGLAQADVDGDGLLDLIGGGRWFKYGGDGQYQAEVVDDGQRFTRAAAGQLKAGGRPELLFGAGDAVGPLRWYEWIEGTWLAHELLEEEIDHGHSLAIADMNDDGWLDIFAAEMRLDGANPDAKSWVFLGDGNGNFVPTVVSTGLDNHESRVGDLDGDGDLDILSKPWNWETPGLRIWLNTPRSVKCEEGTIEWQRHVIDAVKPWRSLFVTSADLNGDGHIDVITGGWWYQNPGIVGSAWSRHPLAPELNNMALVADFDQDGDQDVLGTKGKGSSANATFVWAQNDGSGNFTGLENIAPAEGNFLQGVTMTPLLGDGQQTIVLSWHDAHTGLQALTIPADPAGQPWAWHLLLPTGAGEALSAADIDRDGATDLLLGTEWLRNAGGVPPIWQLYPLYETAEEPDRNALADMDQDGRLDAVIGYEAVDQPGKLAWYSQPVDATQPWVEHLIATPIGPMSLGVVDLDGDGDLDVVSGEHYPANPEAARLLLYENVDGRGATWQESLIYQGDEHHDGAHVVDIDQDGDWDVVSIGWISALVTLYENRGRCLASQPTATPSPTPTLSLPPTATPTAATVPTFTVAVVSGGAPTTRRFIANPAAVSYQWHFGDGNSADGADVEHTYGSPGNYLVTLLVTGGDGTVRNGSQAVTIEGLPPLVVNHQAHLPLIHR